MPFCLLLYLPVYLYNIIVTESSSDHLTYFNNSRLVNFIALLRMKSRCITHAGSLSMLDIVVDLESVRFCGVPLVGQVMVTKSNIPRKKDKSVWTRCGEEFLKSDSSLFKTRTFVFFSCPGQLNW